MDTILNFYNYSVADLKDAKALLEIKSYPSAIYHFQQSVEKLAKAYSLVGGIIPFDQFKSKVGHQSHKIFRKQSQNFKEDIDKAVILKDALPEFFAFEGSEEINWQDYQKSVAKSTKRIQHLDSWEFHELSNEDIDYFLQEAKQLITENLKVDEKEFLRQLPDKLKTYFNGIKKHNPTEINEFISNLDKPNFVEVIGLLSLYQVKSIPNCMFVYYSLFILSLITASHQETTRYPCGECGYNPREYYVEGLEIVDRLAELLDWYEKVLAKFSILFLGFPIELKPLKSL